MRLKGGGSSKLVQLVREIGYNEEVSFELATVTAPAPELKIKIDNMDVELEKEDVVVAEHLTQHTRKVKVNSNVTDGVVEDGMTSHSHKHNFSSNTHDHSYSNGTTSQDTHNHNFSEDNHSHSINNIEINGELSFNDELKTGERVIIAGINSGQLYLILDRAVIY